MKKQPSTPNKPLKQALFERIESEQVCPRSKYLYQGRECAIWILWIMSVAVGALAVAVSLFVVTHNQYALYEATHNNILTYMVEMLPYLWIVVFGLMLYISYFNLRNTRFGYRYSFTAVLVSSMFLSFAAGSALQLFGFGYTIDNILGQNMNMYMSQYKLEQRFWQVPNEGRLIGKQIFNTVSPAKVIVFEDITGQSWRMDISELPTQEVELLASQKAVRVLGLTNNQATHDFHACGAYSWMVHKDVTMDEMNTERQAFVESVRSHARNSVRYEGILEADTLASTTLLEESTCSKLSVVQKMPVSMNEGQ